MNTHELAEILLAGPKREIVASVDLSTCDTDAENRAFGKFCDVQYEGDGITATMLFESGELNYSK